MKSIFIKEYMRMFLLVSLCVLVPLGVIFADFHQPGTIIPSVINGLCSVCHTSSCANCPKAGGLRQQNVIEQERSCSVCSNKGPLCSQEAYRAFDETTTDRLTCRVNSENECGARSLGPKTVYIPRSAGTNTARQLVGWEEFIHQYNVQDYYLTTGHVFGSYRSIRPQSIARVLFGDCVLRFAGSQVQDRGCCELLGDNFGLSPYLRGTVTLHPSIQTLVFDNQFFLGLDPLYPGLYMRFHAPVVHTRWNLGLTQQVVRSAGACRAFPEGAMGEGVVPSFCSFIQALEGDKPFGDMKNPSNFGHIRSGTHTKTGFADIDVIVGWDFLQCDDYHFGLYGQVGIPCGNKPSARQLFAPLIGNGHHVEVGLGISGHYVFWQRDVDTLFAFYCEGNAVHLCKNSQMRSFDFCNNGPLSRYMLLKQLTQVDDQFVYEGTLVSALDIATRPVSVSIALQGDISATFCFRSPCIIADLGYNFYGRTKERVCFKACPTDSRYFGVKGTEGVYGLEYTTIDGPPVEFGQLVGKIPLNATQHNATAFHGADTDNSVLLTGQAPSNVIVTPFSRQDGVIEGADVMRARASNPPLLISAADLHKQSGTLPSQATHKVFGYLGYNLWDWDRCYNPYLGLGGELELDAFSFRLRTALNQWSIWVKGGFEF